MSQITDKDIKKIAKLARIAIDDNSCENLTKQVSGVINWIEQLNEINTDNIKPLTNVNQSSLIMAQDVVSDGDIADDILSNTKHSKYNYFSTPKVIE